MPIMVPPGQGVTVTTPAGQQTQPAPQRQAAPPSPFRPAHGPDVVIMPHHVEKADKSGQQTDKNGQPGMPAPSQMSRRGAFVQLMRSKLRRPVRLMAMDWHQGWKPEHDPEVMGLVQGILENPHETHRYGILADKLSDIGHPHADLLRWYGMHGLPAYMNAPDQVPFGHPPPHPDHATQVLNHLHQISPGPIAGLMYGAASRRQVSPYTSMRGTELGARIEMGHLGLMPTGSYGNADGTYTPYTPMSVHNHMYNVADAVRSLPGRPVRHGEDAARRHWVSHITGVGAFADSYHQHFPDHWRNPANPGV